jgi:hypothetical protein
MAGLALPAFDGISLLHEILAFILLLSLTL